MDPAHPLVLRIQKEHDYARAWYKPWFRSQKFPSRITRFLYLKNFPRHFLSKYPHAIPAGTIDVGTPDIKDEYEPIEVDETTDDDLTVEDSVLDTSGWTQQMDRLYYSTLQILQQHYLAKLVYKDSIQIINITENTSLQLRHSFANIAGWDNELLIWLHNIFVTKLPSHEHLIPVYHEVMKYLGTRLPSLIDKFYAVDRIPSSVATTPATSAATTPVHPASGGGGNTTIGPRSRHSSVSHYHQNVPNNLSLDDDPAAKFVLENKSMPRRLTSNPLILLVPNGPSVPQQPTSARMEYWKMLISSMGQLINVNIPYRPEQNASEVLQMIKTSVKEKIRDVRKKKFNESRPLILVGFNHGSLIAVHCALENPGQVSSIICLGFPVTSINGFRGDLDDPMLEMNIPILFVVGQMSSMTTLAALERLRESMSRSDTGLVVVGGANDKLIMSYRKKLHDATTQYHVDRSIADEIFEFVNSINMQQPDSYY